MNYTPDPMFAGTDSFAYTVDDGVRGRSSAATQFSFAPIHPNPARGVARLNFILPIAAHVELVLYDLQGRRLLLLQDGLMEAGEHRLDVSRGRLVAGVYQCSLKAGALRLTRKLILL